ncbi:hypothetical protein [Aquamicrobium sp. LC103]|uniref:hypothetical protein n=1 Tax=Aquamicrobium sp. LC103 TaxID=1120658 RepID=UPI000A9E47B6|nr:hypothetical protein [Aquamicrobium sp. LC103]TKT82531.1 hypothetical protein XW59_000790 [Aquamicrobium sp. LC103]
MSNFNSSNFPQRPELQFRFAALKFKLMLLGKANFNPNQPRVPAGSPEGGNGRAPTGTRPTLFEPIFPRNVPCAIEQANSPGHPMSTTFIQMVPSRLVR